ncbi:Flp1 family type IVb pilin [Paenibacillus koleovorans]|uniref:Flp1 family type IVb pilin n=1 Tax=Paenibacillus koleovorans TaxID=121608 RepID=UPI000FD706A9|nr:Flp1 family type IVb pilin [Paenibacillus koleovorans]
MRIFKSMLVKVWREEDGLGTLELLLIVAVLVIVAVAFRKWILSFIKSLFGQANEELNDAGTKDCLHNPSTCSTPVAS